MDSDFMDAIAAELARNGIRVARFEFPYMRLRRQTGQRRPPDPPAVLRASWLEVLERLGPGWAIGGKSMGGRIASVVADECAVRAVVCLGYPFHPAGRPEKLRVDHLRELRTPTLIVQGTRDALGSEAEIASYELSPRIRVRFLSDGDHSLRPRVRSGHTAEAHLATAASEVAAFLRMV
jgi:predicted alpha/beta-hydrolase family hydrolase